MPTIKNLKRPAEFRRIAVNLTRNDEKEFSALLGITDSAQRAEILRYLERGLSHVASMIANQENVYLRSDTHAALRKLANAMRRIQAPLEDAYRVLGGIMELWDIDYESLRTQCEVVQAAYSKHLAKGSLHGGELRTYKKQVAADALNARTSFFDKWAQRGARTQAQFTRDRKAFLLKYENSLQLRAD